MNLDSIHSPEDIKNIPLQELPALCDDLRSTLLKKLGAHGGHVGPNLGFLEATVALHYVFNAPADKIVFDVSHQSYVHKMLTGRMQAFTDPAHYNDVSGYTEPDESPYDLFTIGHTSTSVALAAGLAKARDLRNGHENVIAVLGDGALSGGEAFEGLDYAATLPSNFIVVFNDNDMSIAENHGGIYAGLKRLRDSDGHDPDNIFRTMGFDYLYVKEGNDPEVLVKAFRRIKDVGHPVVIHINTQKGHGYAPAETRREHFHYQSPFDLPTGDPLNFDESDDYGDITAKFLLEAMKTDPRMVAITAGTPSTIGFTPERRRQAGKQFIDAGIAEQAAVAIASGLAKGGARPFFGVVSSFIQRAYDQLAQDVAINRTAPVFSIFYGTVYGMNDVTHLGWFDIALVSNIPGMIYLAPTCKEEYLSMLGWAMRQEKYPVAIRVPGVVVRSSGRDYPDDYSHIDKFSVDHAGDKVALIGAGNFYPLAEEVRATLGRHNIDATLINPRFLSGLDDELLASLRKKHKIVVTMEDGILDGGFGQKVASYYGPTDMLVLNYGLKKEFVDRYDYKTLAEANRLTAPQITNDILKLL